MEPALLNVGLPVLCAGATDEAIRCDLRGFVKPGTDYSGWYKSKLLRGYSTKRWFCPEHASDGKEIDDRFYARYQTPAAELMKEIQADKVMLDKMETTEKSPLDELYDLLD